jgi:hypothetical protein
MIHGDRTDRAYVPGSNVPLTHAVHNTLHPAVKQIVVAATTTDFVLPAADIAHMVKQLAAAYEQKHDVTVVADLVSPHNRGGAVAQELESVGRLAPTFTTQSIDIA